MKLKKIIFHDVMKDILCILILIIFYIFVLELLSHNGQYILGSNIDFSLQHYTIPEYFRKLFYQTHDLLPDFSFHLGAGQNIYYLSYYGLFNPIIMISYLFPSVNMLDYIIISISIEIIISCILFYFYLKKNHYSRIICTIVTFIFLCSAPLIFHSHRHIMFINYFPFLILGFYGVDQFIYKKQSWILILSIVCMIFTSYYFSVSALVVLFILSLFKYIQSHNINKKDLIKFVASLFLRFIIAAMISAVLILPTLYTLLNGRIGDNYTYNIIDLLKPSMYMLYSSYSMGLTLICLIATIYMLFSKKKANIMLSMILLLVSIFPVFNYLFNGLLYINAKSLIPFIPLVLINVSDCLTVWFYKMKKKNRNFLLLYIVCSSIFVCLFNNSKDDLMTKKEVSSDLKNEQTLDDNIYRTNTSLIDKTYINKVCCLDEYKTTIYSSSFNVHYQDAYTDIFHNPLPYRNRFMLSSSNNILFQMYMSEKYIYSKENYHNIYSKLNSEHNINIYQNNYVLPIGYATAKTINTHDFQQLNYPDNIINILGNVISDNKTNIEIKNTKRMNLDYEIIKRKNIECINSNKDYFIFAGDDAKLSLKINNTLNHQLLFINFDVLESDKDIAIQMNDVKNKLTNQNWKYSNHHSQFNYVFFNDDRQLDISFSKGIYKITNIEVSILDFEQLKNINQDIDPFLLDKKKTKGDTISGTINVTNNGYFTISLPYDEGFDILVDSQKIKYERTNCAFIGFPITKGKYNIKINYHAPYKNIAIVISLTGIILFLVVAYFEKKHKK